jgi:hypothetical protein
VKRNFPISYSSVAGVGLSIVFLLCGSAWAQTNSCVNCHQGLDDKQLVQPVLDWRASVHKTAGVDCHSCHGGDPSIEGFDAMMTEDFAGVPSPPQIPELCSSCHSSPDKMRKYNLRVDEFELFKRSGHGRALFEKGDTKSATCVSCHGAHKVLSKSNPASPVHYTNIIETCGRCHSDKEYMKAYGLPTDQVEKYRKSYHAQILYSLVPGKNPALAPTCASCHTHSPLLPSATDVPEICGRCHSVTANYYKDSPHFVSLSEVGVPRCIDCHGNHAIEYPSIEMFSSSEEGHCGSCHDEASAEYQTGQKIREQLMAAQESVTSMEEELDSLEHTGRNLSDLQDLREQAKTNMTEVLPIVHTLSVEKIQDKTNEVAKSAESFTKKVTAFKKELEMRRTTLSAVLAVIFINVGLLWWKRRSLDHSQK